MSRTAVCATTCCSKKNAVPEVKPSPNSAFVHLVLFSVQVCVWCVCGLEKLKYSTTAVAKRLDTWLGTELSGARGLWWFVQKLIVLCILILPYLVRSTYLLTTELSHTIFISIHFTAVAIDSSTAVLTTSGADCCAVQSLLRSRPCVWSATGCLYSSSKHFVVLREAVLVYLFCPCATVPQERKGEGDKKKELIFVICVCVQHHMCVTLHMTVV